LTWSLSIVRRGLEKENENLESQIEAENNKSDSEQSQEQLERLNEFHQDNSEKLNTLVERLASLSSASLYGFKDPVVEIRLLAVEIHPRMAKDCPSHFFSDNTLKYLGNWLNDPAKESRKGCLDGIQLLLEFDASRLAPFMSRFYPRIARMINDKDVEVAKAAMNLLVEVATRIDELNLEIPPESVDVISMHVFHENAKLAEKAAIFMELTLLAEIEEESSSKFLPSGARQPKEWSTILKIVDFYLETDVDTGIGPVVDAFWTIPNVLGLKKWNTIPELLLGEYSLSSEQEATLIQLLHYSVEKACTLPMPTTKTQREQVTTEKDRIARALIKYMPQLVSKFGSDCEKALRLIKIPKHFDCER